MVAERNLYQVDKARCESLRRTLKDQGRSVAWLARKTGFSRGYVSNILHGNNPLTDEFQAKALEALGLEGKIGDHFGGRSVFVPISVYRRAAGITNEIVEDTYVEAWKVSWLKEHAAEVLAEQAERAYQRHQFARKNVGAV